MKSEQSAKAKEIGTVYLVGAGPGDPGLITVRGLEVLQTCDAVVYDRLVPLELVVSLPPEVKRYYVGKASGSHSLEQEQINELLARLALEGLTVARLKGGDPFVFGRGGEEALHLKSQGIPFELVPGVTAGLAAAAYTGIPLTHRGKSVYLLMITAHETPDKLESQVPWDWLAKGQGGTLLGYMGVTQLPQVVQRLLDGGMNPETPAAIVERGATARQRIVAGSLQNLPDLVREAKISPPALFIIGEVVSLHEELNWVKTGVLSGKKVMVTRPANQASELYALLRDQGAYIMPLPTLTITEHVDGGQWNRLSSLFQSADPPLIKGGQGGIYNWLIFSSENGVHYFLKQFLARHDFRALARFRIAVVGAGTVQTLRRHGLQPDLQPSELTTTALIRELPAQIGRGNVQIIRVRGNLGDDRLEKAVVAAGAKVYSLQVYSTSTATWDEGLKAHLNRNQPDVIVFTSGSTVTGLVEILGAEAVRELASRAVVASIGPTTSEIIREAGLQVGVEATVHSVPGLVEAIVDHFQS